MCTLLALIFTVATDDKHRNAEKLLNDKTFLAETLGIAMIFEWVTLTIKYIFKRRHR